MRIATLLFLVLAVTACKTGENTKVIGIPRNEKTAPSTSVNRFLPIDITNVYISTFANETPLSRLEDTLLDDMRRILPEANGLVLANAPRTAELIISGRFTYHSLKTISESLTRESDRVREFVSVSFSLHHRKTGQNLITNQVSYCLYYNRVSPPVRTREDLYADFSSNIASLINEYVRYGFQRTQYDFGDTRAVRMGDAGQLYKLSTVSNTNAGGR